MSQVRQTEIQESILVLLQDMKTLLEAILAAQGGGG